MRLNQTERHVLKQAAQHCFRDDVVLKLFGSRARDDGAGGDIDLLVQTTMTNPTEIAQCHIKFLSHVYQSLGDQKIDLLIDYPNRKHRPIIFTIAQQEGVML